MSEDRIGGQLAREAPERIRAEAKRRRAQPRIQPEVQITLTVEEAKALLRFDLDPAPEYFTAEAKVRRALDSADSGTSKKRGEQ